MEEEEEEGSGVYRPQQVKHSNEEEKLQEVEEFSNTEQQCEAVPEMDDSQLVIGSPVVANEPADVAEEATPEVAEEATPEVAEEATPEVAEEATLEVAEEATHMAEMEMETETEVAETSRGGGKRKRGRLNRVQTKAPAKKNEEEDVCFICFDGGNLVLCDRRGCPKAYHPACVNRDEAFFRSRGRWNCGWHICSNCEKAAHHMCYTCTFSLCKGCIKEAGFLCVRGNKGFCEACMRTVMLIEKNAQGNKEMAQVDFDDKNSWEYLFKDYWIDLKGKLSLTSDELTQARNPWKGSSVLAHKVESFDELYYAKDEQGSNSDSSSGHLEVRNSKRRKAKRQSKSSKDEGSPSMARAVDGEGTSMLDNSEWASKELLEFVAHMKNGDISVLSQFNVQALLLEYIKRNNLRDPRRKSQIVCDSRLENLFGKARVGHFEMLKLLESHFLIKEDTQADSQGGIVDTEPSQLEAEGSSDGLTKAGTDKRRKTRKKGEGKGPQTNLDDYAAIDVHNIRLLYLRRNLMEDLLEDNDKFNDKVIGSFVRIKIPGSGQKQELHRLVQVIGTSKAAEPYETGKRTTDFMLEILNLNKTEIISIDIISNQEFSEDECKRLRQSIKCGLISRMTVGEVQEKAMAVQSVRVNDWLEAEILRLSHLRDRASEKGRRKELRECVEKVQLLKTPAERVRRLQEIPEVHADPNMDPSYESEEDGGEPDDKRRDNYMRPRNAGFSRNGREPISPGKGSSASNDAWSGAGKNSTPTWEPSGNMSTKAVWVKGVSTTGAGERMNESSWSQGRDAHQSNSWEKPKNQVPSTDSDTSAWNGQAGSSSGIAQEALAPLSTGGALSSNISETDKMWHYQDPSGKIQGPFSMVQLRKWSTTGYFPADLRIWRTTEKQEDSIKLTGALDGKFQKELPQWGNSFSQPETGSIASGNDGENKLDGGWKENINSTWTDKKQSDGSWNSNWKDASGPANDNTELTKTDEWGLRSPSWTAPTPVFKGGQAGYSSHGWDSSKGNNAWSGHSQVHSPLLSPSSSGNPHQPPYHQGREGQGGGRCNSGLTRGNSWNSNTPSGFQSSSGHGYERRSKPVKQWSNGAQQSTAGVTEPNKIASGWGEQHHISVTPSTGGWDSNSLSASMPMPKPSETSGQGDTTDFSNPPTPTPKLSAGGWTRDQGAKNKWAAASTASVQQTSAGWGSASSLGGNGAQLSSLTMNEPIKGPAEWGGQSPTPAKPSVGEWDLGAGPASALNPTEMTRGHDVAPIPYSGQLTQSSTSPSVSVEPTVGVDGCGASHTSSSQQTTVCGPNASGSLSNQSVSGMTMTDGNVTSSGGSTSPTSGKGSEDLIQGSENSRSSSVHGSSPIADPGMGGVLSSEDARQIPFQSTTDEQHGFTQVLDPRKKSGAHSPVGAKVGGETRTDDVSSNVSMETQGFAPEPLAPASTNAAVDLVSDVISPSKIVDLSNVTWVSSGNSHKPSEEHNGWGSVSAQKPEMDPRPGFASHGWGPVPAQKQEPPTSSPTPSLAAQKPEPAYGHWGDGRSSVHNSAASLRTSDQAGNHPTGLPFSDSSGPSNTKSTDWSTSSSGPSVTKPSSCDVGTASVLNSIQNNSLAPSDTQRSSMSCNPLETGPNMQPAVPATPGWGMGAKENSSTAWRPTPENLNPGWGPPQGNANMGWGGSAQGNANIGWGAVPLQNTTAGQGTMPPGNTNRGSDEPAVNTGMWGSQQKHNGDRFSGPWDRGLHAGNTVHGGGRSSWNRQLSFGSGGGRGGSSRPPPKGQRVCKFHESGHCKKGADCDFLHP